MADVVAEYMLAQNRPLNAQNVADALGRHGIKKGLAQKYLDTLSERGTIAVKEAGKSKVYFAPQTASVMTPEEVAEAECAIKRRTEELANSRAEAARKRARLSAYATQLTVKQMKARTTQLATENGDLETKLAPLRASKGAEISPAEMKKAEDAFVNLVELWGKRKRGFDDVFEVIVGAFSLRTLQTFSTRTYNSTSRRRFQHLIASAFN